MIHSSADIDDGCHIDATATIWHLAQVRAGAQVGAQTSIGRGAYIGSEVCVGRFCKIQNGALIYEPATLADGVFIGPGAILTNDRYPRAVTPDGVRKSSQDWNAVGVTVMEGASVGAGAICVAPVTIGRWSMIAAGAVVIHDVPDFALVAGTPARPIGWVGRNGKPLVRSTEAQNLFTCQESGRHYVISETGQLEEVQ